ncbi:MAG: hypothetical protein QOJ76_41 [Acidobacteriota bacterium]|jgi:hypothetical protein|nr:hypothetical protein [Acidobacteriota bacterium]
MTIKAHVLDYTPSAFRRSLDRQQQPAEGEHVATVLDDMADGILAIDYALTFAGFGYEARQLTLSIVGLLGDGADAVLEAFDGELAAHLNCSDRTIRRWRSAHLKESERIRFALLEIKEGEYDADNRVYGKTSYRFITPDYVDAVVTDARASELYARDRRAAIETAAEEHYADIPDAPPRRRKRKPRRAPAVKVEQAFVNAARSVEKGRRALQDLSDDSRAALLESRQGAELREMLLKLQADIAEVLEKFPQPAETEELEEGIGHFVRYPPADEQDEASAEDMGVWEKVERRAVGAPSVLTREVSLRPPEEPPPGRQEMTAEELEAEAVRAEACGEM